MTKRGRPPHPDVLTPRQWDVLHHLREGQSNSEIARQMGISADGVKFHVSEILGKLALRSRHEAARWQPEPGSPGTPQACLRALGTSRRLSFRRRRAWRLRRRLRASCAGGRLMTEMRVR